MKMKFLAIGLLSAVMASSVVFADDTTATTAGNGMSGQQAPDSSATQSTTMSGTGQASQ